MSDYEPDSHVKHPIQLYVDPRDPDYDKSDPRQWSIRMAQPRRVNWWLLLIIAIGSLIWVAKLVAHLVVWLFDAVTGYSRGKK